MTFISYSQNFEDVMLWRALKHIEQGFYIDVGAWSPDIDSVTRAFYERGWCGINVEPNPEFHEQLKERRPHDQNLCLGVGDREGYLVMNFLGNPGLSTLDDAIAEEHRQAGWSLTRQDVQVKTLSILWHENVPTGQVVHFLKVDVEGLEEAVLRGNDWTKNRPWIVVVEATLPMSQVESHAAWEPILLGANYCFAYADGLNRFYVAKERSELLPAFNYPPNVFDDFVLITQRLAEARTIEFKGRVIEAEARVTESESRVTVAEVRATEAKVKFDKLNYLCNYWRTTADALQREMQAVYASRSWRVTKPLRLISIFFCCFSHDFKQFIKAFLKLVVAGVIRFVQAHPLFKERVLAWLCKYPAVENRLRRFALAKGLIGSHGMDAVSGHEKEDDSMHGQEPSSELSRLTPRARQIYSDLKAAIMKRHKEKD